MTKTILIVLLALVVFVAVGSVIDPAAHSEANSRWYYVSHPYIAYRTYTVAPVVVYQPYYVAPVYPVYRVYPVYTYQYWYNRFAAPQKNVLGDTSQPKKTTVDNSSELKKTGIDQLTK